jgi:phosphocarrier protein HPr
MISKTATVQNGHGIHCRPSTVIIKAMADYDGTIRVIGEQGTANCRSVMELMSMELYDRTPVTIEVEGPDEAATADQLVELFECRYDFPDS